MTYSSGGPGYPPAQPSGPYAPATHHAPATHREKVDDAPGKLPVYLLAGVAILGLAAYLLSFGPVWKSGDASVSGVTMLGIIAILFAALFAVVALLPKQGNYTPAVTATAAVGFLLTIWDLVKGADVAGWALIAIVILSALQTVVAIAALLLDAGVITPPAPRPKYDAYQPYGGGFYGQPQFGGPPTGRHGPAPHGSQSFGQPQGLPPRGYPGPASSGGFPAPGQQSGPPTPPTGFPAYSPPHSAPAGRSEQPAEPSSSEGATQQIPAPQQSPSPEESIQLAPLQQQSPSDPPPS